MLVNPRPLLLLLVSAALVTPSTAFAVGPDGAYRFEASGANQVLILGDDADFGSISGLSAVCGNIKRKPTGNYKRDCDINWPGIGDQDGSLKGSYDREDGKTVVKETLKLKGDFDALGTDVDFELIYKFKAVHVDGEDTAKYSWSSKGCVDGRCDKDENSSTVSAAAFTDILVASDWTLDLMDMKTTGENKIKGTAKVTTGSGQTIKFEAKGEYVPGEASKIKLKNKKGAKIKLKDVTIDGDLMTATFKNNFLGNKSSFMATSVPIEE